MGSTAAVSFGLLTLLGKGALVLLMAALLVRLCRRACAGVRHLLWGLGIAGVLLVSVGDLAAWLVPGLRFFPTASLGAVRWWADPVGAVSGSGPLAGFAQAGPLATGQFGQLASAAPLAELAVVTDRPAAVWPLLALSLWALGCGTLLARVGRDLLIARRLVAAAVPVTSGALHETLFALTRGQPQLRLPELRLGPGLGPFTAGFWRPIIVAPTEAEQWSPADRRAVLAHELAHVRRRDCLSQLLARLAVALHWPNPLAWWAQHRLRAEREMAADDAALATGGRASDYAGFLLKMASAVSRRSGAGGGAALAMAAGSPLGERVERLLEAGRSRRGVTRGLTALGALGTLLLALPLACFGPGENPSSSSGQRLRYALASGESGAGALPQVVRRVQERLAAHGFADVRASSEGQQVVIELPAGRRGQRAAIEALVEGPGPLWLAVAAPDGEFGRRLRAVLAADPEVVAANALVIDEIWTEPGHRGPVQEWSLRGPTDQVRGFLTRAMDKVGAAHDQRVVFDATSAGHVGTLVVDLGSRILLEHTQAQVARGESGRVQLDLRFGADSELVRRLTSQPDQLGHRMVLVVGRDRVLSAPILQKPIADQAVLTVGGDRSDAEATADVQQLVDDINDATQIRLRPVVQPRDR